eukprot:1206385-Prymnesium_polylepis.1
MWDWEGGARLKGADEWNPILHDVHVHAARPRTSAPRDHDATAVWHQYADPGQARAAACFDVAPRASSRCRLSLST